MCVRPSARYVVARVVRERHLHQRPAVVLDEHVAEGAVRGHGLGIHHGVAPAEGAKFPGHDRCELPGAQRRVAQAQHPGGGLRGEHQREPRQSPR